VSEQVRRDRTLLGFFASRERALYTLESIYSEDIAPSINSGFDTFFNNLRDLTRDPANRGARAHFIAGTQEIVDVFNNVFQDLRKLQMDLDQDITARVDEINHLTSYIAQLNGEVVAAGAASMDFEDKRDEAVRRLSEIVPITVLPQDSGTVNIQLSGVGTLVQDHLTATLEGLPDPSDRRLVKVNFTGVGGSSTREITTRIDRGELGGLLQLRDQDIGSLINESNTLAQGFADAVNAQHQAGFDLNGDRGEALFTFADPAGDPASNIQINSNIVADSDLLAISQGALRDPVTGAVTAGVPGDAINGIAITELQYMTRTAIASARGNSTYTGSIEVGGAYNGTAGTTTLSLEVVAGGDPSAVTYRVNSTLAPFAADADNGGAGYSVADLNVELAAYNVNLNLETNGSAFSVADQVEISLINRDSTFNRKVAETLQFVGKTAANNYEQGEIYSTRLSQSERLMESVSGVSLDEELLDLTRFEKQFAANGKVIQTVNELMDSVLELVR
jgi:flagellar hook-associated protein 1 FlgK